MSAAPAERAPRVRHQARDALALMAFSAGLSAALTVTAMLLTGALHLPAGL